jgi:hypothetical protein
MAPISPESKYFPLSLDSLRALGGWAADCAQRALDVYEAYSNADPRPRAAIEGIREFAAGGKRTAQLRTLALAAYAAALEASAPAASAAANAACLAASSAYTHPLADIHQTKHILGPAAYAALALELSHPEDASIGDREIRWAMGRIPHEAREILLHMPSRDSGTGKRVDRLMYDLDAGIRGQSE